MHEILDLTIDLRATGPMPLEDYLSSFRIVYPIRMTISDLDVQEQPVRIAVPAGRQNGRAFLAALCVALDATMTIDAEGIRIVGPAARPASSASAAP